MVKMLVIGDSNCGKSSLVLKYTEGKFDEGLVSTIGVDFKLKYLKKGDKTIAIQIWDTAGQERYRTITNSYYRGIPAVIVVFDLTDDRALANVQKWIKEVKKFSAPNVVSILVGNKVDLTDKRVISEKIAREFAMDNDMQYFETSAKQGLNLDLIFETLVDRLR
ncbi:rab family small GTPase [Naegleria gruberi]|uniref:Rab family small GTPase n=1 Tax=Naegleria gruberi TaxID=5762 RepID=D2V412_NAEGR|nr:rab family small GTPase [Naegleria gruberi]EFC48443.1 rab family small GTPase [Naegleria gruberi]|eukprot:XP_002681187.1 rab family small GTPase [Naegleria gruberi strain NEG-M]